MQQWLPASVAHCAMAHVRRSSTVSSGSLHPLAESGSSERHASHIPLPLLGRCPTQLPKTLAQQSSQYCCSFLHQCKLISMASCKFSLCQGILPLALAQTQTTLYLTSCTQHYQRCRGESVISAVGDKCKKELPWYSDHLLCSPAPAPPSPTAIFPWRD